MQTKQTDFKDPTCRTEVIVYLGATETVSLIAHRKNAKFEIWVWADSNGDGYVTKQLGKRAFGWKLHREAFQSYPANRGDIFAASNRIPFI